MKPDDQKPPVPGGDSQPKPGQPRSYARRIDCGGMGAGSWGAAPHEVENGRGTGRLRNPPEDH